MPDGPPHRLRPQARMRATERHLTTEEQDGGGEAGKGSKRAHTTDSLARLSVFGAVTTWACSTPFNQG